MIRRLTAALLLTGALTLAGSAGSAHACHPGNWPDWCGPKPTTPPTTTPPVTEPPETLPPVTTPPETEPPATVPETEPPTTEPPTVLPVETTVLPVETTRPPAGEGRAQLDGRATCDALTGGRFDGTVTNVGEGRGRVRFRVFADGALLDSGVLHPGETYTVSRTFDANSGPHTVQVDATGSDPVLWIVPTDCAVISVATLPATGAYSGQLALAGFLALGGGAAALLVSRRRVRVTR